MTVHKIKPRRMDFQLVGDVDRDWLANNPFLTHFFTGFAAQFPEGERFMIDAVKHYRNQLDKHSALSDEVSGFIGQEAHHANAHDQLNDFLAAQGAPTAAIDKQTKWAINVIRKIFGPKQQLAMTAGLEHFTSMFGTAVLRHPEIAESVHLKIRPMFVWHAIEEVEHNTVAYDVYQKLDGSYARRITMYLVSTLLLISFILLSQLRLTINDPRALAPSSLWGGLKWMFGFGKNAGYIRRMTPEFLQYFKPSFHPASDEKQVMLETWHSEMASLEENFLFKRTA
ncbi:metal-dependent hydrolase [Zhongshania arctica]|uniref:Metal-dependent hydrolase n=1 Tax=Zhongshania arctica TaxID=3238302 RepID=A0ABV3TU54_9GAMM